jgi:enoyl-[acyl-carrier protein] reductase II
MLHICEMLQIDYPIIQGGMGNISNAQLTAAVSEAGGLGTIGCGTMTPTEVENIIIQTKGSTRKNFALNIAIGVSPYTNDLIDVAIRHEIPVVSLSAGNPAPFIPKLHEHGIKVIVLVASVKHAKKAEEAGADILVAEGFEAAGINSHLELTTFTLIPQIVENVQVPVLAAGGIGDGKGLAAAFMLGASGVQIGTRLIATKEAPFHKTYKQNLVEAEDTSTVILGRSIGRTRRVLTNSYAEKIVEHEKTGMTLDQYMNWTTEDQHIKGAIEGDMENGFINSGLVAGLIDDIPSVEELLKAMIEEANERIQLTADKIRGIHIN